MSTTLVSCYYPMRSKYLLTHYIDWAQNFLQLEARIVLFTPPSLAGIFRALYKGPPENLYIVEIPFEELDTWVLWKDTWIAHHDIDPEKDIHSPELYAIWAQKPFFVNRAIDINPFGTDFFFWCDIGAFRTKLDPIIQKSFPCASYLPTDRVLLSAVVSHNANDAVRLNDGIIGDFRDVNRIAGALWGGGRMGCRRWLAAYRSMLERYFAADRFAGKDQSVMLSAYLEDPSVAHIVKCNMKDIDIWFYLSYLCSSHTSVCYELNESYIIPLQNTISVSLVGGLGNQMFQISTAYAHAKRCGAGLQLLRNKKDPNDRKTYWSSTLKRCTPYLTDALPSLTSVYERSPTVYSELPNINNMCLEGYRQSPKYFSEIRDELRAFYAPSEAVLSTLYAKYSELLKARDQVVIVHARRTDYLKNDWNKQFHGPLDVSYYVRTIKEMTETVSNPVFVLCSDDPLFWLEVLPHVPELQTFPFHILADEDDVHTLALLSLFKYFIIANSTFSWWGAWLAYAERVYAPAHWFGPAGPSQYEDIYDPSWIRI